MNQNSEFLGDEESMDQLVSKMHDEADREKYLKYGHRRLESGFDGRLLIIYSPQGLHASGRHRDPEIFTTVKVLGFEADSREGCRVRVEDLQTGDTQTIDYIPARLFGYDVFVSVPPFMRLRWDAKKKPPHDRSMSYALLIKTKNRSDFHSAKNTYVDTPNALRKLYPDLDLQLRFA